MQNKESNQSSIPELFNQVISVPMENKEIDMQVTCAQSGEKEKIKIVFQHSEKFDPNYESDLIKFIKSTGILDDSDIIFKNGYIFKKSGVMLIDEPSNRDFAYKLAYIDKRDKKTLEKLVDNQQIEFIVIEDNEEEEGIWYPDYFEDIKNETSKILLKNPDKFILEMSKINILFTYPTLQKVTFQIKANDEIKGFTIKELSEKCIQYFHMLYYLSKNYDTKKGEFIPAKGDGIFRSICDWEYENNGIAGLTYRKDKNAWEVICLSYI